MNPEGNGAIISFHLVKLHAGLPRVFLQETHPLKPIRVLQRAAELLRALEKRPGSSLAELHADTAIPKPTLLRLLATLETERMVWRAMADGRYRARVSLDRPVLVDHKQLQLAERAAAHLTLLRRRVVWPSDLTVRQGHVMKLIETSRRESSLALHRDAIGFRIDMLVSAVGRAYLAFCPEAERERILAHLRRHPARYPNASVLEGRAIERVLAQTRERGYGVRDLRFGGLGWVSDEEDDRLAAIAVPVMSGTAVLACINIVWPRRFDTEAETARRYLALLQRTAVDIAAAAADGPPVPVKRRRAPRPAPGASPS